MLDPLRCIDQNRPEIDEYITTITEWIEVLKKNIRRVKITIIIARACGQDVKELEKEITEYETYLQQIEKIVRGLRDPKTPFHPLRDQVYKALCDSLEEKPFKRIACKLACMTTTSSCDGLAQGVRISCSRLPDGRKDLIGAILPILEAIPK